MERWEWGQNRCGFAGCRRPGSSAISTTRRNGSPVLASDRFLVLGEKLLPPEGYEADALLATTFSLDLDMALGLPLALIRQGQFAGGTVETTSRLAVIEA